MQKKRKAQLIFVASAMLAGGFALTAPNAASLDPPQCLTDTHVAGSHFEVDTTTDVGANLTVDKVDCIDWLNDAGTAFRSGVTVKTPPDASGNQDNAFGKGTSENDIPKIVSGSIPPNKSDLTDFGVFTEAGDNGGFLALFWSRVQNPSGTTNMDFELNRNYCETDATKNPNHNLCDNNGKNKFVTPVRTAGDKLISYDLSNGGTVPVISIRTWSASGWGPEDVISDGSSPDAKGSVNEVGITQTSTLGPLDPFTFGEAVISFNALFPNGTCGGFGSAYLKSRSSDSFSAEIKDFVEPMQVRISNCLASVSTEQSFFPNDTATLTASDSTPQGTVTFELFDENCTTLLHSWADIALVAGHASTNNTTFAIDDSGKYNWKVTYNGGGDGKHNAVPGTCGSESFTLGIDNG